MGSVSQHTTFFESGGSGGRTILLLHGLGCTGAVWNGVRGVLGRRRLGRWIAPDLSGHGASPWRPHYSVGQLAADLAEIVRGTGELFIVGHSLGAYVGLALASNWFGIRVAGLVGIGPKINWPESDLKSARELAARPVRWFDTRDEALSRYRRASGLGSDIAPTEDSLARGIVQVNERWRLAQDPRTFDAAGAPFETLARSSAAHVLLARGEHDQMVSTQELKAYAENVEEIAGGGHNVHVESPERIVASLERLAANV